MKQAEEKYSISSTNELERMDKLLKECNVQVIIKTGKYRNQKDIADELYNKIKPPEQK